MEATTRLRKVVDIDDIETGTVRLKRSVDKADEMALDTASTKTTRVHNEARDRLAPYLRRTRMTSVCPAGHDSTADGYCDVCGCRSTPPPSSRRLGVRQQPLRPAWATAAAPTRGSDLPPLRHGHVAEALFCESCGYDFTTGSMPRPLTPPEPAAEVVGSAHRAGVSAADAPDPVVPDLAATSWVAELWIDPAWYDAQDSPDPLPSPGCRPRSRCRASCWSGARRAAATSPPTSTAATTRASRRKSQLTTDGSRWFVEDLESANGTFIGQASSTCPRTRSRSG